MESEHGSDQSNKHSTKDADNSTNKDDALAPLISDGNSDHDSESEADIEISVNGNTSKSPHSASSSSSHSSAEDYFHMDPNTLHKSNTFPLLSPKSPEDTQSPDAPGDITTKSEQLNKYSPFDPSSQVSSPTGETTMQTMSPVQSPPIQVMEKSGGYDPNRIPASVFASRTPSAKDWSTASNESLFSLQLGNGSFSREHFLMMDEDVFSGELNKSGELKKSNEHVKPGLPPLSPVGKLRKVKTMDANKKPTETNLTDESKKDSSKQDVSDQVEKEPELEGNGNSSLINRPSDGSGASCQSFAFPILVDTSKSSSGKGRSPRQQDSKVPPVVYVESPKTNSKTKKSSSYWCCCCCYSCCSLPHWSCPHCWSWKWCKNWCCCCCCCCG